MFCTSQITSHNLITENVVAKTVADIVSRDGLTSTSAKMAIIDTSMVVAMLQVDCLRTVLISLLLVGC